jgi:hypothetical protein
MGPTTTPPARIRLWTRFEYECLIDLGVFQPGERPELIDGLLLVSEPQGYRHAATIRRVLDALRRASRWCHATPAPTATRIRPELT